MAQYPNSKIATGWDNEAGYTVVESIVVSGTTVQLEDLAPGGGFAANTQYFIRHETPQQNRVTVADASSAQNGHEMMTWVIPLCSGKALEHWINTYVGKVTIATLRYDKSTYEDWNAMGGFPEYRSDNLLFRGGHWWHQDVKIKMQLVVTT